ncbi:MAG TPA: chromate efflux transporter [Oculatellaceae cyanobacterium]
MKNKSLYKDLVLLFLKLGTIAFGGPAAHIAMMETEVVRARNWLTHQEFLDLMGATNLIPGPNSTELAIHIGHRRAGWPGLIVAGVSFIVPAMLIVMTFAWLYVQYGKLPYIQGILYGIKPVIMAVIVQALWNLSRTAVKNWLLGLLGLVASFAVVLGVHELMALFGAGFLVMCIRLMKRGQSRLLTFSPMPLLMVHGAMPSFGLWPLFFFFLKVGSVLFGSGYVLLAFLQADLVERYGWLTQQQLLDAIVVGQITPGPVFTTATFIGYLLGGVKGGVVATIGIFLPAFVFVALSAPFIRKMRESEIMGAFLDGLNVASLALMAVVTFSLAKAAIVDIPTLLLVFLSGFLLIRTQINSVWLIILGGFWGFLSHV